MAKSKAVQKMRKIISARRQAAGAPAKVKGNSPASTQTRASLSDRGYQAVRQAASIASRPGYQAPPPPQVLERPTDAENKKALKLDEQDEQADSQYVMMRSGKGMAGGVRPMSTKGIQRAAGGEDDAEFLNRLEEQVSSYTPPERAEYKGFGESYRESVDARREEQRKNPTRAHQGVASDAIGLSRDRHARRTGQGFTSSEREKSAEEDTFVPRPKAERPSDALVHVASSTTALRDRPIPGGGLPISINAYRSDMPELSLEDARRVLDLKKEWDEYDSWKQSDVGQRLQESQQNAARLRQERADSRERSGETRRSMGEHRLSDEEFSELPEHVQRVVSNQSAIREALLEDRTAGEQDATPRAAAMLRQLGMDESLLPSYQDGSAFLTVQGLERLLNGESRISELAEGSGAGEMILNADALERKKEFTDRLFPDAARGVIRQSDRYLDELFTDFLEFEGNPQARADFDDALGILLTENQRMFDETGVGISTSDFSKIVSEGGLSPQELSQRIEGAYYSNYRPYWAGEHEFDRNVLPQFFNIR